MSRRRSREHIFVLLYQKEFAQPEEEQERVDLYFEQHPTIAEEERAFITQELEGVKVNQAYIDRLITDYAKGWKINRMAKVDLTILRLAIYEMYYVQDIPQSVAINEAIELAKKYSSDTSPSFINGVLGKIATEVKEVE
jgi:N utilization substance protein B